MSWQPWGHDIISGNFSNPNAQIIDLSILNKIAYSTFPVKLAYEAYQQQIDSLKSS